MKCKYCATPKAWKLRRNALKCRACKREWRAAVPLMHRGRITDTIMLAILERTFMHRTSRDVAHEL